MSQTPNPKTPRVFLCHSSDDKTRVRNLHQRLSQDGIHAWLDEEELIPGQDWNHEITRAVRESDLVIVCLSRASINKSGYVQKEIKHALDVADEQPEGTIFIVPLKLEECEVPDRLSRWHWVNYFEERGYERLLKAVQARTYPSRVTSANEAKPLGANRETRIHQSPSATVSNPADQILNKLNEAADRAKREKAQGDFERERNVRFAESGRREGPAQLNRLEQLFAERCDSLNNSSRPTAVPDLTYDNNRHVLEAGKYAVSLHLSIGQVYDVRVIVGLHPDAAQFMAELPEVEVSKWHLLASADDSGFFWYEVNEDRKVSSEEIVNRAIDALGDLLVTEM